MPITLEIYKTHTEIFHIVFAYLYTFIFGHYITRLFVGIAWKKIEEQDKIDYLVKSIGIIERFLYVTIFWAKTPLLIGIWLTLKLYGRWEQGGGGNTKPIELLFKDFLLETDYLY